MPSKFLLTCILLSSVPLLLFGCNSDQKGKTENSIALHNSALQWRVAPTARMTPGIPLDGVKAVSSGRLHTCALTKNDSVQCWGQGDYGQLGNGQTIDSSVPVDVQAGSTDDSALTGIVAISAGDYHTCALTDAQTVKCWGRGYYGRLGNAERTDSSIPVNVHTSATNTAPLTGITAISSGAYHTCALTNERAVKCWGAGWLGVLGDGNAVDSSTPVNVRTSATDTSPLTGITAISSGQLHTCALTANETLKCWGRGYDGQLGNGGTSDSSFPALVHASATDTSPLTGIAAVSSGAYHTCAVTTTESVKCWGQGTRGRLGNNQTTPSLAPVDVHTSATDASPLTGIASVSSGIHHTCALTTAGTAKCWGRGQDGRLGDGATSGSLTPVNVRAGAKNASALSKIATISAGANHTCASTTRGAVKCWGRGWDGLLGNGPRYSNHSTPVNVRARAGEIAVLTGIAQIDSGRSHTCVVTDTKTVKCWGKGRSGQLGNGETSDSAAPLDVRASAADASPLTEIAAVSSGTQHTCALTTAGTVKCWGNGAWGRLGNDQTADSASPVDVHASATDSSPLSGIVAISSGYSHTCALTNTHSAKCWGEGWSGQLGNGTVVSSSTPVEVRASRTDGTALTGIVALSSGGKHTCALIGNNGPVKCWGYGDGGVLGDGVASDSSAPIDVHTSSTDSSPLMGITAISSGYFHSCALTDNGTVKCWGHGHGGLLGNGETSDSLTPVFVRANNTDSSALGGIVAISSGDFHTCALTDGKSAVCWGRGKSGQLGNGTNADSSIPVRVRQSATSLADLTEISAISSGGGHVCVVTTPGFVKCWGSRNHGRLGNLETGYETTPIDVLRTQVPL